MWSGSTCSGSAADSASHPRPTTSGEGEGDGQPLDRDQIARFERQLRRELQRSQIQRQGQLPPARPLSDLNRALPMRGAQDLAAVHKAVAQMKRRLATLGHDPRGAKRGRTVDVRRTMRSSLETGGVPLNLELPAAPAAQAGDLRALRRLDFGQFGLDLLPFGAPRPSRLVPQAAQLRLHRADLRGDPRFRGRAGFPRDRRDASPPRAGSPTSPATPTTAGSGASSSRMSRPTSVPARP